MQHSVKILDIADVTHNVRRYTLEKPEGYEFKPGQATDVSLDEDGWREKKHPFTFTALTDAPHLEFTIKSYFDTGEDGMTERLHGYKPGQSLILRDVWGTITYKGPGIFIAGGAGVTPFIAILRDLHHKRKLEGHTLIASNRTEADIILREEFESFRGLETLWTVTDDRLETCCTSASTRRSSTGTSRISRRTFISAVPTTWSKSCAARSRSSAPTSRMSPGKNERAGAAPPAH